MAEKTIVEKAGETVGFGMAMASDVAGTIKTAFDSALSRVNDVLMKAPTKKAVKKAASKSVAKKAVKKAPAKKVAKRTAKKAVKKAAKAG